MTHEDLLEIEALAPVERPWLALNCQLTCDTCNDLCEGQQLVQLGCFSHEDVWVVRRHDTHLTEVFDRELRLATPQDMLKYD